MRFVIAGIFSLVAMFSASGQDSGEAPTCVDVEALGYTDEALIKCAEAGHLESQWQIAVRFGRRDPALAKTWVERAAEGEHPKALRNLGMLYLTGSEGYEKSETRAVELLTRASELGNANATLSLFNLMIDPKSDRFDLEAAIPILALSADQGSANAMCALYNAYFFGWGIQADWDKAKSYRDRYDEAVKYQQGKQCDNQAVAASRGPWGIAELPD